MLSFFCDTPTVGPDDLGVFRDAAVTYAACRRAAGALHISASDEAWDLLCWLGVEGSRDGESRGVSYRDPKRPSLEGVETRHLAAWSEVGHSLQSYRQQGYLAETMFAALIRSSYGSERLDFFPTRSELGFYFEDSLLLEGDARWDSDYLSACQAFFMEELMPAELLTKSLALWPRTQRAAMSEISIRYEAELHGVTFLVADQIQNLRPLANLLSALLAPKSPVFGLKELLDRVELWDQAGWTKAWQGLTSESRQSLTAQLCPDFPELSEAILFTAGPELLSWRASAVSEALR